MLENDRKFISPIPKLHTNCHIKNKNLQVDYHTEGKWFIHVPKQHYIDTGNDWTTLIDILTGGENDC